jgi:putative intracellular protease/amidase
MANESLKGLKVAILITDGFEQVEMVEPRKALNQAGAETSIVSPKDKRVRAWNFTNGNLVSSRKPDDIPAFNRGKIDLFSRARTPARQPA